MKPDDDFEFDLSRRLAAADEAIHREHAQWRQELPELDDDGWGLADVEWEWEEQEAWLRDMEALESGEGVTLYQVLTEEEGIALPPGQVLDDAEITAKLMEVVQAMARRQAYLHSTDHLSDRELYEKLIDDIFQEKAFLPTCEGAALHLDVLGSGSDEDTSLWLTYYADEQERQRWAEQFPDFPIPASAEPPFDRDRFLPQGDW